MKKNTMKTNINQIRKISSKMPKTINEAINFNETDDMDMEMMDDEPMGDEPMGDEPMEKEAMGDSNTNIDNFIANMRKESLGIMKALADNPDDSVYQFAKKIFQLADKAHEDQKEGKDIMIGFNPKFLIDALRVIDDETIDIYYVNSKAPCFIRDENQTYIYLILPVNFVA